ncbi:MAG TPA: CvpA family protein [Flavobacterium sp.]|jgi:membrane protein required for colicin V production
MTFADILIGLLLCYGLFRGFMNGFFMELASLVSTMLGIYVAIKFSGFTGDYLGRHLSWNPYAIKIMAFALTFVLVIVGISLLAKLFSGLAGLSGLGIVNKIGGAMLAVFKMVLLLGIAISFLEKVNDNKPLISDETAGKSILYEPVKKTAAAVFPVFETLWEELKPVISTP